MCKVEPLSRWRGVFAALVACCLVGCSDEGVLVQQFGPRGGEAAARILFVAGRDSHGPLWHEHHDGALVLARALHVRQPAYAIDVVYGGWPRDESLFDGVDSVVFYCDGGERHVVVAHLPQFSRLIDAGVGVVMLHYAVEVPRGGAAARQVLRATGGYFETHWSVNPIWEAEFTGLPDHPISAGVAPFALRDEWYFNLRFTPQMAGVTPILAAVPPPSTVQREDGPHSGNPAVRALVAEGARQVVAWAYERPGGGRGFGYTGGHYHANWDDDNARRIVLNAIEWTAAGQSD